LTVTGCWFEGFDTSLDIAAFRGSTTTVKQSMLIRAKGKEPSLGWGLRLEKIDGVGSNNKDRRLILDHCTANGKGLLDLIEFSSQSPLKVEIHDCAVQTNTFLSWETGKSGAPISPEALGWDGHNNLYDVKGKAWVVLSRRGDASLVGGPTDLDSWSKLAKEQGLLKPPFEFVRPASKSPEPTDFAVKDEWVGADPNQVGPQAQLDR
jgi:hypothetical protein